MLSLESMMERVGHFGWFQKRMIALLNLSTFLSGSTIIMASLFVAYTPPHRCYIPAIDDFANSTGFDELPPVPAGLATSMNSSTNLSDYIPVEIGTDGEPMWSQCYRYQDVNANDNTTVYNRSTVKCDHGWKYYTKPGLLSATMEFNLVCDDSWIVPLIPSIQMFGLMTGSLAGGYLSDRLGRRFALLSCWVLLGVCMLALVFVPVWVIMHALWFVVGFCVVVRSTSGMVLLNELSPQKHRHAAAFTYMVSAALGYMFIPVMGFLIPNWRYMLGAYAFLEIAYCVPLYCYIRESLRWLLQNHKYEEAEKLLQEIAQVNKVQIDSNKPLLSENEAELKDLCSQTVKKVTPDRRLSYIDLAKIPFLRRRLLIFGMSWFAVTLTYFGLSLNTNNLGVNRYVSCVIAGAMEIPGNIVCYVTIKRMGGRRSYMLTTGISGLCLLLIPLLKMVTHWAVIVCNMIGKLLISSSFANIYIFTGDLFPTLVRTQSYGACSFVARWAGVIVPFVLYAGEKYYEVIPNLVLGLVAVVAATGMYFLPETQKEPMPDTMEDAKLQDRLIPRLACCSRKTDENDNTETREMI